MHDTSKENSFGNYQRQGPRSLSEQLTHATCYLAKVLKQCTCRGIDEVSYPVSPHSHD